MNPYFESNIKSKCYFFFKQALSGPRKRLKKSFNLHLPECCTVAAFQSHTHCFPTEAGISTLIPEIYQMRVRSSQAALRQFSIWRCPAAHTRCVLSATWCQKGDRRGPAVIKEFTQDTTANLQRLLFATRGAE